MELTKEYFDKQLGKLATKEGLEGLEISLEAKIEKEIEGLARMTSNRFDEMEAKAEGKNLNSRMVRIEQALNIK